MANEIFSVRQAKSFASKLLAAAELAILFSGG